MADVGSKGKSPSSNWPCSHATAPGSRSSEAEETHFAIYIEGGKILSEEKQVGKELKVETLGITSRIFGINERVGIERWLRLQRDEGFTSVAWAAPVCRGLQTRPVLDWLTHLIYSLFGLTHISFVSLSLRPVILQFPAVSCREHK